MLVVRLKQFVNYSSIWLVITLDCNEHEYHRVWRIKILCSPKLVKSGENRRNFTNQFDSIVEQLLWEISESSEGQIKSTNSLVVFLVSDPPGDWRPPLAVTGNYFLMNVCSVALVVCGRVLHCLWDQLLSLDLNQPNLNSSLIINLICFWFCHNVFAQHCL